MSKKKIEWYTPQFGSGEKFEYFIDPRVIEGRDTDPPGKWITTKYLPDGSLQLARGVADELEAVQAIAEQWEEAWR